MTTHVRSSIYHMLSILFSKKQYVMTGSLKDNGPLPESLQIQPSIHFEKINRKPISGPSNSALIQQSSCA